MKLRDIVSGICMNSNIPVDEIIWDEVALFDEEHKKHGDYDFSFKNSHDGELIEIRVFCNGNYLENLGDCPQCGENVPKELTYSIIYQNKMYYPEPSNELKIQSKERMKKLNR